MVVLVTGGRSGFGLLTAEALGRAGHTVYAGLRDVDTAGELRARAEGLDVRPVQLDVTSAEERERVVGDIEFRHGAIDVLVNNAGMARLGPLEQFTEAEFREVLELNLVAQWAMIARVLPAMRERRQGRIVQLGSMAGRVSLPTRGVYAASKHALRGMIEALRFEVQPFGIRVSLVEPGPHATEIFGRNRKVIAAWDDPDSDYRALTTRMGELVTKTGGEADDPQAVVDRILALIVDPDPPLWNALGPHVAVRLFLRWLLPGRWWERLVNRSVWGGPPPRS